ncbi:GNAT family N-acetyltransferase [Nocardioides cynanchi]|uniref:GNAT family N-acetyltransferase n=1 Tax=Nocardioides cynanchi TaxID=2558918 RepID=UPI001EE2FFA4|nr:GNAT family N-acetyltransferase [Nocardioides cynanchi]
MPWTIAPITLDDADEVGRVHVEVWRQAYAGLMPADHLAGLDPAAFASHWRDRLLAPVPGVEHWLARDETGIVGIATSGPGRDEDRPTPLELYAINVLARGHGTGVSDALLARAVGDRAAYLWVLEGNDRALAFYRRHGFADEGGRKPEPDTGTLEIRMARSDRTP